MAEIAKKFAVLAHVNQPEVEDHWDILIELDSKAEKIPCWQLDANPLKLQSGQGCRGKRIFDHRRKYLSYSGPITGNRGEVKLLASGEVLSANTSDAAQSKISIKLCLNDKTASFDISQSPNKDEAILTRQ